MEKIININMAGRIIAIEDAAYTRLKHYLESLHQYFAGKEGAEEIINDIESRIAELMDARIRRGSSALSQADVEEIISGMGTVADFEAAEAGEDVPPGAGRSTHTRSGRKFLRDMNDKIAGGVCSGLAHYMNVDPALIRILFAILTLGGWGFGLVLYFVLWIIVPAKPLDAFRGRRLFRDGEDKLLGGVCSGLANYFDKDAWIFRLVILIPVLLSMFGSSWDLFDSGIFIFGSFSFSLVLIYIVLWIVLPVAKSDYEKMEMRGEKVDLASIRDNVIADLKDRTENFRGEFQESAFRFSKQASDFAKTRSRTFAQEAVQAARPLANRGGHVVGTILKVIFLIMSVFLAFVMFMAITGYAFGGFSGIVDNYILMTPARKVLGWATIILFLAVPVLAMLTFIVRRLLRLRAGGKYFAWGYSLLWVAGWCCLTVLIASLTQDYSYREQTTRPLSLQQPSAGVLELRVPGQSVSYHSRFPFIHGNIEGWDVRQDGLHSTNVHIIARLSPDSFYHAELRQTAYGSTDAEARSRAEAISYSVASGTDGILNLANEYLITKGAGFRGQQVDVIVQVPAGKRLRYDQSVSDKLHDYIVTTRHNRHRHHRDDIDIDFDYDDYENGDRIRRIRPNTDYVMGADGVLRSSFDNSPANGVTSDVYVETPDRRERMHRRRDSLDGVIDQLRERRALRRDSLEEAIDRLKEQRNALREDLEDEE